MNVEPAPLRVPSPFVHRYVTAPPLLAAVEDPGAADWAGVLATGPLAAGAVVALLEQAAIAMEAATASAPKRRIPMVNVVPPGRGRNTGRPCAELAD
jgi:hypothetical protein